MRSANFKLGSTVSPADTSRTPLVVPAIVPLDGLALILLLIVLFFTSALTEFVIAFTTTEPDRATPLPALLSLLQAAPSAPA